MQPARASLPEFEVLGNETITAPMRRTWNLFSIELFSDRFHPVFQRAAAWEHPALVRSPGAKTAFDRSRSKICFGLFGRSFFNLATDRHLSFKLPPIKMQGSARVGGKISPLFTFVIRKKDESI